MLNTLYIAFLSAAAAQAAAAHYQMGSCDATFTGTLDQCFAWYESDPFSPRMSAEERQELIETGKLNLGFPWGELTLKGGL
jgi:hypothetical protein